MSIKRNKSESKFDLPQKFRNSTKNYKYILETTVKTEDIVQKVEKEVQNKIVYNNCNDIDYYDIPVQQDQWGSKRKDQGNFRSIYMLSELQMLRGTPYYERIQTEFRHLEGKKQFSQTDKVEQEIKLNTELKGHEKDIRQKLKQKKGNVLFLSEIYDKLDENIENQTIVSSAKYSLLKRKDEEKKQELLDHLDLFHKKIKKEREEQKKLQQLQKLDKEAQEKEQQRLRSFQKQGIDRRQSLINIVKSNMAQSSRQTLQHQDSQGIDMFNSAQPGTIQSQRSVQSLHREQSGANLQIPTNNKKAQRLSSFLNQGKLNKLQENKGKEANQEREEFLNQFNDAYSQVKTQTDEQKEGKIQGSDRETTKQLQQYVQGGVGVDVDIDENAAEENLKFDITPEGIQLKLNAIQSNTILNKYKSQVLRSIYFEKQSQKIEVKLNSIIVNTEAYMNQKENTLRIIRQENHVISQKMRDIRNYMESLLKEKFELQSNENEINSPMGSHKGQDLKKSGLHSHTHAHKPKESRQTLINELMKKEEKIKDIEDQLEMFRDNFKKFKQKMNYNTDVLKEIEDQINSKKKEYKNQIKTQKSLYKELLIKGDDVREVGLGWCIHKLWSLEEQVTKIDLPSYLDDKAKEYLLKRAKKLQFLNENIVLLDLYLDMYKTNLKLHSQGGLYAQTQEFDEIDTQIDNQSIQMENSTQGKTMLANNNTSLSLPSINKSNINNLNITTTQNNLSYVDVELMREIQMESNKSQNVQRVDRLIDGLDEEYQDIVNNSINRLNKTKHTSADLVYEDTTTKIKKNVKNWLNQERKENRSINFDKNQTNQNDDPDQFQPLIHKVELYEDGKHINQHSNREEFIEDYRILQSKISKQTKKLKQQDEEEIIRIIKEFDFKKYDIKYNTNCGTVLGAIFGAAQADRLIIRYGMSKK